MMGYIGEDLKKSIRDLYGYSVRQIEKIRPHLYLIFTTDDCFVLKLFSHREHLNWQIKCVDQLLEQGTQGIVPFVYNRYQTGINEYNGQAYGLMPFIPGEPVDLTREEHRRESLSLLAHFHLKGRGIYGKKPSLSSQSVLFQKWHEELERFKRSLPEGRQGNGWSPPLAEWVGQFAHEVIFWAEGVLAHFPRSYLHYLEEQAQWERQIAHLDIESHNLLVMEDKFFYLVDYDQLDYAPPFLDLIQYMQLVLPLLHWELGALEELVAVYEAYRPLSKEEKNYLPLLVAYPQDVIRTWLHLTQAQSGYHPRWIGHFVQKLAEQWEERRRFVQHVLPMLK